MISSLRYSYSTKMEYSTDFDVYDACQTSHYKFVPRFQDQMRNPLLLSENDSIVYYENSDIPETSENLYKTKCTISGCKRSYSRSSDMTKHLRSHTECLVTKCGIGHSFTCTLKDCGKFFFQREDFLEHHKSHI